MLFDAHCFICWFNPSTRLVKVPQSSNNHQYAKMGFVSVPRSSVIDVFGSVTASIILDVFIYDVLFVNFTFDSDSVLTEIFSLFSSCFWFWNRHCRKQRILGFVSLFHCVLRFRKCMTLKEQGTLNEVGLK